MELSLTMLFQTMVPITCSREHAGKIDQPLSDPIGSIPQPPRSDGKLYLVRLPDPCDRRRSSFFGADAEQSPCANTFRRSKIPRRKVQDAESTLRGPNHNPSVRATENAGYKRIRSLGMGWIREQLRKPKRKPIIINILNPSRYVVTHLRAVGVLPLLLW